MLSINLILIRAFMHISSSTFAVDILICKLPAKSIDLSGGGARSIVDISGHSLNDFCRGDCAT